VPRGGFVGRLRSGYGSSLLQLNRPVGILQERLPPLVLLVRHLEVEQGCAWAFPACGSGSCGPAWAYGRPCGPLQPTQAQTMSPTAQAALAARHDVVEAQLRGRMLLAAILALVVVAAKILRRLNFTVCLGSFRSSETDDARHLNLAAHGRTQSSSSRGSSAPGTRSPRARSRSRKWRSARPPGSPPRPGPCTTGKTPAARK